MRIRKFSGSKADGVENKGRRVGRGWRGIGREEEGGGGWRGAGRLDGNNIVENIHWRCCRARRITRPIALVFGVFFCKS